MVNNDTISVEPTWLKVDTPKGTRLLGIKVVPYIIKHDTSLLRLLKNDRYRSDISTNVQHQSRRMIRFMYKMANVFWSKTVGLLAFTDLVSPSLYSSTLNDNWKHSVVLGKTNFKDNLCILLNRNDLNDDFLGTPKEIKKLFSLYWPSLIFADEVNKTASFCMTEYSGMCSMVNYTFLYSNVSRHAKDAYETMEDVRRSSGPLFKISRRFTKMIPNKLANEKLELLL